MEVNQYFYSLAKISAQKAAENGVHVDPKFILNGTLKLVDLHLNYKPLTII